jgi:hypothetical protein
MQIKGVSVASVASVLNQNPLNIAFHHTLGHNRWRLWLQLVQRLLQVQLNDGKVVFVSGLTSSGIFSVKSMYLDLLDDDTKYLKKYIWTMKVPLKIKIYVVSSSESYSN